MHGEPVDGDTLHACTYSVQYSSSALFCTIKICNMHAHDVTITELGKCVWLVIQAIKKKRKI